MAELLAQINGMSIAQRLELIQAILRDISLDSSLVSMPVAKAEPSPGPAHQEGVGDLTQTQIQELLARRDEALSGQAESISGEEVKAKLIAKYGLQN